MGVRKSHVPGSFLCFLGRLPSCASMADKALNRTPLSRPAAVWDGHVTEYRVLIRKYLAAMCIRSSSGVVDLLTWYLD